MPATVSREAPYLQTRPDHRGRDDDRLESFLSEAGFTDIVMPPVAKKRAVQRPSLRQAGHFRPQSPRGSQWAEASAIICQPNAIPVLFVTAYADKATHAPIAAQFPRAELLRKPVGSTTLIAAVSRALQPMSHH